MMLPRNSTVMTENKEGTDIPVVEFNLEDEAFDVKLSVNEAKRLIS